MDFTNIIAEQEKKIGFIKINRPDQRNALNLETLHEIEKALDEWRVNQDIRVIIFTGAGEKSFAAGADIRELNKRVM
ncbi:MAG TPA: enoyl-CoA hydratase-related protein, partial [Rummeliibacillus sp.]|nr:enoyl-CoA hydratase-related protein [Rummeliibacillus sp.]